MSENKKLVIIGAGPQCKVIIDIIEQMGCYEIVGLTDMHGGDVLGYPILGDDSKLPELFANGVTHAFVALGSNKLRKKLYGVAREIGFDIASVISPTAVISRYATIGAGVTIMPGAVINAGAIIGDGALINTNASVDHDCHIGNFVHIAPGCAISGSTTVGECSFLGTGTRVIDSIKIGDNTMIGAGASVVCDIESNVTAVGVPARIIKRN